MKPKYRKAEAGGIDKDEILPEYDFGDASPNEYAARYPEGATIVILEPDVAAVVPNADEVKEALPNPPRHT